jgi:hypothetical protein
MKEMYKLIYKKDKSLLTTFNPRFYFQRFFIAHLSKRCFDESWTSEPNDLTYKKLNETP